MIDKTWPLANHFSIFLLFGSVLRTGQLGRVNESSQIAVTNGRHKRWYFSSCAIDVGIWVNQTKSLCPCIRTVVDTEIKINPRPSEEDQNRRPKNPDRVRCMQLCNTCTFRYIYIYIYIDVCVCVRKLVNKFYVSNSFKKSYNYSRFFVGNAKFLEYSKDIIKLLNKE